MCSGYFSGGYTSDGHQRVASFPTSPFSVISSNSHSPGLWKNAESNNAFMDYDAFGNLIHSTGTTPNNYLFAGEQFDPDLNFYYNRERYLNVSTGRFLSMDSLEGDIESPLSLHKYLYVGGDPVGSTDPSGHEGAEEALTVAAFAVTIFAITVIQSQVLVNSINRSIYGATTGAGELYDAASYAAGRAIAEAELAVLTLYASLSDAINKAKERVRDAYRRIRRRIEDFKVVPIPSRIIPHVADHVGTAQLAFGPLLTRTTPEQARINRSLALGWRQYVPAGPGLSWDEYPFASSVQGGLGASVFPVPRDENFIQGGIIAASYLLERIAVGDEYVVVVIP